MNFAVADAVSVSQPVVENAATIPTGAVGAIIGASHCAASAPLVPSDETGQHQSGVTAPLAGSEVAFSTITYPLVAPILMDRLYNAFALPVVPPAGLKT